ncbi:hypothetical protein RRG08_050136 [Elysia crispata]|uniref:Uncharacterized protein n=1 Tax=Elysia crispata TaxID=231223 RepID=A0AAE1DA86_9GAST|nr:hypothetical protein RRG08_050136 [Elysia crispata]
MMLLRSGRGLQPAMPKPDQEMAVEPTPGHFEPLRVRRNTRELKGLNLLQRNGTLRPDVVQAAIPPMHPDRNHFHIDPPVDATRCSEIIRGAEGFLRQCMLRPLRNGDKCRHHDAQRRTARTAQRQNDIEARRNHQRGRLAVRRQRERDTIVSNSRFGYPYGPLPARPPYPQALQDVANQGGDITIGARRGAGRQADIAGLKDSTYPVHRLGSPNDYVPSRTLLESISNS